MSRETSKPTGCYNTVTLVFLMLTLFIFILTAALLSGIITPPLSLAHKALQKPSVAVVPSSTITFTPMPSFTLTKTRTPTRTPSLTATQEPPTPTNLPPTGTFTPSLTFTPTETLIPMPTETPVELPLSPTVLPSPTPLPPTITPSPTKLGLTATATPEFSFQVVPPSPALVKYPATCSFQGISGLVLGLNKERLNAKTGILAVVALKKTGAAEMTSLIDTDPTNGFLIQVGAVVKKQSYTVELRSPKGVPLSEVVTINFPANCDQNLAVVNFAQSRPF